MADVLIEIGGESSGLESAARQASAAVGKLGDEVARTGRKASTAARGLDRLAEEAEQANRAFLPLGGVFTEVSGALDDLSQFAAAGPGLLTGLAVAAVATTVAVTGLAAAAFDTVARFDELSVHMRRETVDALGASVQAAEEAQAAMVDLASAGQELQAVYAVLTAPAVREVTDTLRGLVTVTTDVLVAFEGIKGAVLAVGGALGDVLMPRLSAAASLVGLAIDGLQAYAPELDRTEGAATRVADAHVGIPLLLRAVGDAMGSVVAPSSRAAAVAMDEAAAAAARMGESLGNVIAGAAPDDNDKGGLKQIAWDLEAAQVAAQNLIPTIGELAQNNKNAAGAMKVDFGSAFRAIGSFAVQAFDVAGQAAEMFTKGNKARAKAAFALQKAAALANIGLMIGQGIMQAIVQFGPPPSPVGIAAIAAAASIGAVQLALTAAQPPPQAHRGMAPDEATTTLTTRRGEGATVLTERALDALGGPAGVRDLNSGRAPMAAPIYLIVDGERRRAREFAGTDAAMWQSDVRRTGG